MIRKLLFLSILLCCGAAWALDPGEFDSPSDYWPGGKYYLPDAAYGVRLCHDPRFRCQKVRPGQTWGSLFPNQMLREVVMRLNRTNVALAYRSMILVPRQMTHMNYMSFSPFPQYRNTHGHRLLYVNLSLFAFAAYNSDGTLLFWGPVSSGSDWCEDVKASCTTAVGNFRVFKIEGQACESATYPIQTDGGAPMPYCMYYHDGFAVHGSTLSGFVNRSKGCIRLFDDDAQWLNQNFVSLGTQIIVVK